MSTQKFATFVYDYEGFDRYCPNDVNLGDYVQSLAAMNFYPRVDLFVDRDKFLTPPQQDSKIKIIANGWYKLSDEHHAFGPDFDPLFVAFHVNNIGETAAHRRTLDLLKNVSKSRPIGCRDVSTLEYLRSQGIDAYFSGCLTTTLERDKFSDSNERSGLVLADCDPSSIPSFRFPVTHYLRKFRQRMNIWRHLKGDFQAFANQNVLRVTHAHPLASSHEERFAQARKLLQTYANAELLITSRIHCALPCLALGTPVVLIAPYDKLRYRGLGEWLNHIYLDDDGRIREIEIERDSTGKIINTERFRPYADKLRATCRAFVNES